MRMRGMAILAILALVATGMVVAAEKMAAKKDEAAGGAVQGEVLDLACYIGHGAMGDGHAACAAKCAKSGQPIGLLGSDGTVYVLLADHNHAEAFEKTKDLAGKKVEVTGDIASKGTMKGITVKGVKAL